MEAEEKTSVLDKDFRAFFMKSPVGRMVVAVGPGERFAFTEVNFSAAASFDQFANFEARGDAFRRLVQALEPGADAGARIRRAAS